MINHFVGYCLAVAIMGREFFDVLLPHRYEVIRSESKEVITTVWGMYRADKIALRRLRAEGVNYESRRKHA